MVEKQALLEALIQAVANYFELGYKDKIENVRQIQFYYISAAINFCFIAVDNV